MKIVAIAMARNEARIVAEGVRAALEWVDDFVVCDHGSTDGTGELARQAGAIVIQADVNEPFNEGMRQATVNVARSLRATWIIRIDVEEIYHWLPDPRTVIESADRLGFGCARATQAEFWLTTDDVRRGLLIEPHDVPIQKLRRWYTIGHTATVAWKDHLDLNYSFDVDHQKRRNVPVTADGRDVATFHRVYGEMLLQKHYTSQTLPQVLARMPDRSRDLKTFGKYRYNIIVDETIGLHYLGPDEVFDFRKNHHLVYDWYKNSDALLNERARQFAW